MSLATAHLGSPLHAEGPQPAAVKPLDLPLDRPRERGGHEPGDVLDLPPQVLRVVPLPREVPKGRLQVALGAARPVLRVVVVLVKLICLVQGVVCQVPRLAVQVLLGRLLVGHGAHADQALVRKKHAEGLQREDQDVDAKVKLVPVEQHRPLDVRLKHGTLDVYAVHPPLDLVHVLYEVDAVSLRPLVRLQDAVPPPDNAPQLLLGVFVHNPRLRNEVKHARLPALQKPEELGELDLAAQRVHAGDAAHPLVGLALQQSLFHLLWSHHPVQACPRLLLLTLDPVEVAGHHRKDGL
mmetsp:Transcript_35145/g.84859  ORF Transcript_35145/g.84859 Transcript_35145/m.84859 type:complete len:295 (-) Transcript_35145:486-1370(-)